MLATWAAFLLYAGAALALGWLAHRRREAGVHQCGPGQWKRSAIEAAAERWRAS